MTAPPRPAPLLHTTAHLETGSRSGALRVAHDRWLQEARLIRQALEPPTFQSYLYTWRDAPPEPPSD